MTELKHFGERLAIAASAIESLVDAWPKIHALLANQVPLEEYEGWQATVLRLHAHRARQSPVAVVTALFGPTGAGKSTVFRHVTNLDVPVSIERPWTHSVLVAMPKGEIGSQWLQTVFPDSDLIACSDFSELTKSGPADRLYFATSDRLPLADHFVALLIDPPDFDGADQQNWEIALRFVSRAEQVVFIASNEKYMDRRVVEILAQICSKAASLIVVLSKIPKRATRGGKSLSPHENAEVLWRHLIGIAEKSSEYASLRADGKSLAQFLSQAACYYVPHSDEPTEISVEPLIAGQPSFVSRLVGIDAEDVLVRSLLEPAFRLAEQCRRDLAKIPERERTIQQRLESVREDTREIADRAARHLPLGRLVKLAIEEAESQRGIVTKVTGFVVRPVRAGIGWAYHRVRIGSNSTNGRTSLVELERADLGIGISACCESWRSRFPDESGNDGVLSAENIAAAGKGFWATTYPLPKSTWETTTRMELREWAKKYWWLIEPVNLTSDAAILSLPFLVLADVLMTGGLLGTTLGLIAISGGVTCAGGIALALLRTWKLESVAKIAQEAWSNQRAQELFEHLDQQFIGLLFSRWIVEQRNLREAPLVPAQVACHAIVESSENQGAG